MNPMPRRHLLDPATWCGPGATLSDEEKRCSAAWPRSTPASPSTPTTQVGRHHRLPGGVRAAGQHADLLLRGQRRVRRRQPQRLRQRGQVLQRLAGRHPGKPGDARRAGQPQHLQPLPNRLGNGLLHAVPMFKRYSYQGGVCDPLVISWPKGIKARGEVRHQYHHATDIVPTILECCGLEMPQFVNGYEQSPLPGVSMRYSFDEADAPRRARRRSTTRCWARAASGTTAGRSSQCTAHSSGKATSTRTCGSSSTRRRIGPRHMTWQSQNPEKVKQLVNLWFTEAGKYNVLPLNDLTPMEILNDRAARVDSRARDKYIYYPETLPSAGAPRCQRPRRLLQDAGRGGDHRPGRCRA